MVEKTDPDQYNNKEFVKERLKSLLDVVQSVSSGDFSVSVKIPEKEDEFTALSIELDRMVGR